MAALLWGPEGSPLPSNTRVFSRLLLILCSEACRPLVGMWWARSHDFVPSTNISRVPAMLYRHCFSCCSEQNGQSPFPCAQCLVAERDNVIHIVLDRDKWWREETGAAHDRAGALEWSELEVKSWPSPSHLQEHFTSFSRLGVKHSVHFRSCHASLNDENNGGGFYLNKFSN